MPTFPFASYASSDARRFAQTLGSIDDPRARSCVVLLGSVPEGGELLLRADDDVIGGFATVCANHAGPMFIVSNRNAGSTVMAHDFEIWRRARSIAARFGADLLDWLVVEGGAVRSIARSGESWTVESPARRDGKRAS